MAPSDYRGVRSTAAIYGHLIHPMLVVFPIGSLVGALTTGRAFCGTFAMISRSLVGRRLGPIPRNAAAILLAPLEPLAPDGRRPWRYGGAVRNHPFDVVIIFLVIGPLGGELVIRHDIGMIDDRNGEDRANLS